MPLSGAAPPPRDTGCRVGVSHFAASLSVFRSSVAGGRLPVTCRYLGSQQWLSCPSSAGSGQASRVDAAGQRRDVRGTAGSRWREVVPACWRKEVRKVDGLREIQLLVLVHPLMLLRSPKYNSTCLFLMWLGTILFKNSGTRKMQASIVSASYPNA